MSKPKPKRDKKYGGKKLLNFDVISQAIVGSSLYMPQERAKLIAVPERCFTLLREGKADHFAWNQLSEYFNVGQRLCTLHIGNNLRPTIEAAMTHMSNIAVRIMERNGPTPCYAHELASIREGMDMCEVQLRYCSRAEHMKALRYIQHYVDSMPKGDVKMYKAEVAKHRQVVQEAA